MLQRPDIPDAHLARLLQDEYGRTATGLEFLPVGDAGSAHYRVTTADGSDLFLKLRSGSIDWPVAVPEALAAAGVTEVPAPLPTHRGVSWARIEGFTTLLYPFLDGTNGFRTALSDEQWLVLGRAVRRIQAVVLAADVRDTVPVESYAPRWRRLVTSVMAGLDDRADVDPPVLQLVQLLRDRRAEILHLVDRSADLAGRLVHARTPLVVCHSDLHAGNVLVGRDGSLHIVDWDAPILAPKERDLMFVGAGVGGTWNTAREEDLFYRGYGHTAIDSTALVYYRFERIVEDIGVTCEQVFGAAGGADDVARGIAQLAVQFTPGNVVDLAVRTDARHLGTIAPAWGRV